MPWWCRCCGRGVADTQSSIASPAPTPQQTPVHLLAHFSSHPRNQKLSVSTSRTSWSGTRSTRPQHLQLLGFTLFFFARGIFASHSYSRAARPPQCLKFPPKGGLTSLVHPCPVQINAAKNRRTAGQHSHTSSPNTKTLSLLHVFFFCERLRKGSVAERRSFQGRAQEHRR